MSTDSHGHGPQGGTGGAFLQGDAADRTTPWESPGRAGARRRLTDQPGETRKAPPRRRRKARRVHRVVHHLDIWSLAKVASVFVLCGYVISMISGFLLWRAADRVGTIDGIEGFMEDTGGYDTFAFQGDVVFSSALLIGAVLGVLTVCLIVLAGILFNLISDLTGGIRMTVIDEDLIVTPARRGARPEPESAPAAVGETEAPANESSPATGAAADPSDPADPAPPEASPQLAPRPAPSPGPTTGTTPTIDFG